MDMHMRYVGLFIVLFAVGCTGNVNHPTVATDDSSVTVIASSVDPPPVHPNPRVLHGQRFRVETVASGLRGPWAMAWLDDGRLIFTQVGGELCIVEPGGVRRLHRFDEVQEPGDGGLMGLAVSPTFANDGWVYVSYTGLVGKELRNIVARCRLAPDASDGPAVAQFRVLLNAMPASQIHNGLPLRFGPDGMLWALAGDAGDGDRIQQRDWLGGKLLRMTPDGQVPKDNPFPYSLVWTLGHRHGLGFDWHPVTGELYATEQGVAGQGSGKLNLMVNSKNSLYVIRKGQFYNASRIVTGSRPRQPEPPIYTWDQPVGPAGTAFYNGEAFPAWRNRLFVATMSGQALVCVTISDDDPAVVTDVSAVLVKEFGRLRAVTVGPDGYVYVATANWDDEGNPAAEDDRIIRLAPE